MPDDIESTVQGGCLCGAVRYRVRGAPLYSAICHCRSCRKAAAAPSVAWQTYDTARFEWRSDGSVRAYRSSPGVERTFCAQCGSPLTYACEQRPTQIDITSGSLDDPERAPPDREVWLEDRLSWQITDSRREQFQRGGD